MANDDFCNECNCGTRIALGTHVCPKCAKDIEKKKQSKPVLRDRIKELEKEIEDNTKLIFTKKELQEFIKKEVEANLRVEIKESDSYQYGGGYKSSKSIETSWGESDIYESGSFD